VTDEVVLPSPCLVVLVGPSGAGKSTWAAAHFRADQIVSSDHLRAVVGESEDDLSASEDAFALLEQIVGQRVGRRLTTVVDTLGLDPVGQPEPTLFLRRSVRHLGPARADSPALDLTQGAFGLALQLDLVEPTDMIVPRGRAATETVQVESLLFTPTRPAALLDEARARRIPV
jgi:hypothetical protein